MDALHNGLVDLAPHEARTWNGTAADRVVHVSRVPHPAPPEPEALRRWAAEVGQAKAAEAFAPDHNHAALAAVLPTQGFAHWRILPGWVEETAKKRGNAWHNCRLILRLYDVSYIHFNGFNANSVFDVTLPAICGEMFVKLPRPGTWQMAEAGFLLRGGEFIPAARSQAVKFPPESAVPNTDHAGLLVDERGHVESVGNVWEAERILAERRRPKLRVPLRVAAFAFGASAAGHDGTSARFVSELAAGQAAAGHQVHVFVPAATQLAEVRDIDGVCYHPLAVPADGTPRERALAFARAAGEKLHEFAPFDLLHLHEWMAGFVRGSGSAVRVLSLSSTEATRRNGVAANKLSEEIAEAEREAAAAADCVLTPDWLRERAAADLGVEEGCLHGFPLEGRMPNEWESPLDYGHVKMGIGVGPLDRMVLFVGPLEHAAGVDLLVEALPTLLGRYQNLRVAFAGAGNMHGALYHRANQLGVGHAVRLLGHVEGGHLTRLLRAAEALVLPSRWRVPFDDAVVDLARRAGKPVLTTHSGPAHLVRHEENGVLTYDNPGSMVWAVDRVLGDPEHARRLGERGRRREDSTVMWGDVARRYLEFCAARFPGLTEVRA
jgi:glycosyltransferase involved in cell wall biosynthesis